MFTKRRRGDIAALAVIVVLLGTALSACVQTPVEEAPEEEEVAQEQEAEPAPTEEPAEEAAEPAEEPAAEVITIGVLTPVTGPGAPTGAWAQLGSELAVEIINNSYPDLSLPLAADSGLPNLGNATIELVYGDHEGNPERGVAEAERLISQENVAAITGIGFSSVAAAVQPITERNQIPWVEGMASSPSLTVGDFEYFFRVTPHDIQYSRGMFEFLADMEEQGEDVSRIALLHEDTVFGTDSAAAQAQFAEEYGFEIVADIEYRRDALDFTSEIQRLKAADPDVVLPSSYANDAFLILRTMKLLDYSPPILLAQDSGFIDANFTNLSGADANGVMSRSSWTPDLNKPQIPQVLDIARELTGNEDVDDEFTSIVAGQMTAVLTLADAINRAGTTDPEAIRDALRDTDIPEEMTLMPWPGIQFDLETGQNQFAFASMIQRQDRQWFTVWPFDQAGADLVYPFPAWSER